ncbi:PolC-type DNA polymerase III [Pontibacillus salicampi]|uniref:PolC-type DNA polymerase III n=1 Tax=Pontibacillus salicampi TaxID=1449801 RepID=A0ABV6LTA0_9BACI
MIWNPHRIAYQLEENISLSTPIKDMTFVVLDTEATGLRVDKHDRLIEIAAVVVKGLMPLEEDIFTSLANPDRHIPTPIEELTGITNEDVLQAPPSRKVLVDFLRFVERYEPCCLVGHHISFDMTLLGKEWKRTGYRTKKAKTIDTLQLLQYLDPTAKYRDLEDHARLIGTPIFERHSAKGDAMTTAHLFCEMITRIGKKGCYTWGDLLQICSNRHHKRFM